MRPPPPRHFQNAPTGKVDQWLVNFFTFSALLFAGSYIVSYVYSMSTATESSSIIFACSIALKALVVPASATSNRGRGLVVLTLMLTVATFNMLVSQDVVETSLRWLLWFSIVISLNRILGACDGSWIPALVKRLPWLFAIMYVTLITTAHCITNDDNVRLAYHLSGLYGNLIFATGLFAFKFWQRMTWSIAGLAAIYSSGAGGALFTIPIMFVPYILYNATSMPVKGIGITLLIAMGGAFFFQSQLFGRFLDIKLNIAYSDNSTSGLERLERSRDMRWTLVRYGWDKAVERPMGTGLGHTYSDELSRLYAVGHVHNGTVTTLVELGFPGFVIVASLLIWIMFSILRNATLENQLKGFFFTYTFTFFGRSLSENYTPFDLGNFFNFVFLLLTISLFLHQRSSRHALLTEGSKPQPRPPMDRPRPPMRPPMAHPFPQRR